MLCCFTSFSLALLEFDFLRSTGAEQLESYGRVDERLHPEGIGLGYGWKISSRSAGVFLLGGRQPN